MTDKPTPAEPPADRVECPATREGAVRWAIFGLVMFGFSIWTIVDHYVLGKFPYPEPYELNAYLKYLFNAYIAVILIPLGIVAIPMMVRAWRRRLVADAEGIGYVGKQKIRWQDVERLDAELLEEKGVVKLYHSGGRKLKLDAWRLRNFKELVGFIEKRVEGTPAAGELPSPEGTAAAGEPASPEGAGPRDEGDSSGGGGSP
jgi:hypothetical protein